MRALLLLALLGCPLGAAADPVSIIVLAANAAVTAGWVSATVAAVVTATAMVYGAVESRRRARSAAAAARAAYNASLSDRTVTVLQADPPQRVVLGRAVVGGAIVAVLTSNKTSTRNDGSTVTKPDGLKHLVVVFASHRCRALHEVEIDGAPVGLASLDANGWATTGEFASTSTVQREVVLTAGASYTAPSAVTVTSCVEQVVGGDDQQTGTYTLTNGNKTITNTSAFSVSVSFTFSEARGSVRVSYHLGTDDQAADTYLNGLLPTAWTTDHTLSGLSYAVITLDLENQRFQGGPPGITFDVSGVIAYDVRRNRFHNPTWLGADVGTLPNGVAWGGLRGLTGTVVSAGTDDATGLPYVQLRLQGTATSTGAAAVNLNTADNAYAAAAGQAWAARLGVRVMSSTTAPDYIRAQLVSFDSGGGVTSEAAGTDAAITSDSRVQWSEAADSAMDAGTVAAGVRLYVGITSGASYNLQLRLLLPQLWRGQLDNDANDPQHWTDNNALLAAWFLRARQGMAVPYDDVNDDALIVAANACDASISLVVDGTTTTGPTYTCNGSYTTDESLEQVLDSLCRSMAGFATYGADWRIVAGTWTLPVMHLTDADLAGQVNIVQAGAAMDALFNAARSQYMPLGAASPADALYSNATFVAADGVELWTDLQMDWTNNPARVRNLQRVAVERVRSGLVIQYPAKLVAWPLQVGDRVQITSTEYGWTAKTFQVTDWQFGLQSAVVLLLQEDDATIYDLADAATADPTPNTDLPNPWAVAKLTGLAAASGTNHLLVQADGTVVPRVRLTWTASPDPYVAGAGRIEVAWRIAGRDAANVWRTSSTAGDATGEYLVGAADGDRLNIQVTAINGMGVRAAPALLTHTVVGKTQPPANVPSVAASLLYGAVRVAVPASTEADVVGVILRRGASWAAGVPLVGTEPTIMRGTEYLWAWPPYGTYTIWAKYLDSTGHESASAASTSITVNDAIRLGSDGIDVDLAGINLCPNSSFEIDRAGDGLGDGWTAYEAGSYGSVTRTRVAGRLKGYAQRVYSSALDTGTGDRIGVRRDIPVGAGALQQVCASAYVWGSSSRVAKLLVYAMQGATVLQSESVTVTLSGTNAWKRLALTMASFPATADTIRVYVWMEQGSGASAVLVVDDIVVEESSLPSAWHPSPLDELIGSDGLGDNAATEVITVTSARHLYTIPSPGNGTTAIFDCYTDWTNDLGEEVLVEVSASWNVTVNILGGFTAVPASKITVSVTDPGPGYTVGELYPEQPVPDIPTGVTTRWTCARSLTATVPDGETISAVIDNSIITNSATGSTIDVRDAVVRFTVIKR